MSFPDLDPNWVYRDYQTDGVPATGTHEPTKWQIRRLLKAHENAIVALIGGQGGDIDLARGVIHFTITGGDENAIIAEPDAELPDSPGSAIFIIGGIAHANTGPVTINGKSLRTNSGNEIVAGGLPANSMPMFLDLGDHFRLVSDQASAAIVAAAENAAARAENAAASVEYPLSYAPQVLEQDQKLQAITNAAMVTGLTARVPSDYLTIQDALDCLSPQPFRQGVTITILVEAVMLPPPASTSRMETIPGL